MPPLVKDLLLVVLIGTIPIAGFFIKHYYDLYRDVQLKLSDKKYNCYAEIINILFDLLQENKELKKKTSDKELTKRVFSIKTNLFLYGSDGVIKKFDKWEKENSQKKQFKIWTELAILVRKDMGNKYSKIDSDFLLRSIFSNEEEYNKFKKSL